MNIELQKSGKQGTCLYESLAVQSKHKHISEREITTFRKGLLDNLEKNFDQFKDVIRLGVELEPYENPRADEIEELCKERLHMLKENTEEWGGLESVAAFADLYKTNAVGLANLMSYRFYNDYRADDEKLQ